MNIVTIDFETYYDADYSLTKLTTEEYIRSPLFEAIGMGWKWNSNPAEWYHSYHVRGLLGTVDWSQTAILCHNTAFDGAILSWRYGIKPKLWLDTLSMSRPTCALTVGGSLKALASHFKLGVKGDDVHSAKGKRFHNFDDNELFLYGEYCKNDVELTYKLFNVLAKDFPPNEIRVIDQTLRMYTEPKLKVNMPLVNEHIRRHNLDKDTLIREAGVPPEVLRSNDKFADELVKHGVNPPIAISKATNAPTFAFNKTNPAFYKLLDHDNPAVAKLVAARLGVRSTIELTRAETLRGAGSRGDLPIMLHYYGAHTGRDSGGDRMNLQNLPRNGGLRRCLLAPKGYKVLSADLSQIEARITAWLAGQMDMLHEFAEQDKDPNAEEDIYTKFATLIFGRRITKADKIERFIGKTCILGLGYGMSSNRLAASLSGSAGYNVSIDATEAYKYVMLYRRTYSKIPKLWEAMTKLLNAMTTDNSAQVNLNDEYAIQCKHNKILLPNGLALNYPELTRIGLTRPFSTFYYSPSPATLGKYATQLLLGSPQELVEFTRMKFKLISGTSATENKVQALANIVLKDAALRVGHRYPVVLRVHDEVVALIPEDEELEAVAFVKECMTIRPSWAPSLPIGCEIGVAQSYGDC